MDSLTDESIEEFLLQDSSGSEYDVTKDKESSSDSDSEVKLRKQSRKRKLNLKSKIPDADANMLQELPTAVSPPIISSVLKSNVDSVVLYEDVGISQEHKTYLSPSGSIIHEIIVNHAEDITKTTESVDTIGIVDNLSPDDVIITEAEQPNLDIAREEELETTPKKRAKKGQGHPEDWKVNMNKMLRMKGEQYDSRGKDDTGKLSYKSAPPRSIGKRCSAENKCNKSGVKKCSSFTEEERNEIFNNFWMNMDWKQRKIFVRTLVDNTPVKQKTTSQNNSRRSLSLSYALKKEGCTVPVCKTMFLGTLGLGEWAVRNWVTEDGAGEKKRKVSDSELKNKKAREHIREFLQKLPKVPSHYCRSSSSKQYLEPDYQSIAEVYRVYKQYSEEKNFAPILTCEVFRDEFHKLNIGLFQPKKDQCDTCLSHQMGTINDEDYARHVEKKNRAREEKAQDKESASSEENSTTMVHTMDMQAVQLLPQLKASALYFSQKLACHNFTVYNIVTKETICYVWHEGEGDVNGSTIASCIIDFINTECNTATHLIFYSDGCNLQNRNVYLSNALLNVAMKSNVIIEQKYLTKGHTQMECDSVHSTIESKKKNKQLQVPAQYVEVIEAARRKDPGPYKVKYLSHDFFRDFSGISIYNSIRPGRKTGDPCVVDIVCLKYNPSGTIQYKLNFDAEYKELPRRPNTDSKSSDDPPKYYKKTPKIGKDKFNDLQKLKKVLQPDYHPFYDTLCHE